MMGDPLTDADYVSRSRGVLSSSYYIVTPSNLVGNALPHFEDIVVRPLVIPRPGKARFGEYLLELGPGAHTSTSIEERLENFFYVLSGEVTLRFSGKSHRLQSGGFAYLPVGTSFSLKSDITGNGRLLWTKRRYQKAVGVRKPAPIVGAREQLPLKEDTLPGSWYRELIPIGDAAYDFTMLLLTFAPGVYFSQVEMHHQEHGLYMLRGQGVYHLCGSFHEVMRDDFIYMAPYCPQYFYATGWEETEYLLFKDVNRDGFWDV